MATILKLRSDIKKLKGALTSKGLSASIKSKLKAQLEKAENELASMQKGGKPRKVSTTKGTQSALDKLKEEVKKKKYSIYKGSGVDLKKDSEEAALPIGRRISKGLKGNQYGDKKSSKGHVYYEYRANRLDVKQPSKKAKYPILAKGGELPSTDNLYALMELDKELGYGSLFDGRVYTKKEAQNLKNSYEDNLRDGMELKIFSVTELLSRKSLPAQSKELVLNSYRNVKNNINSLVERFSDYNWQQDYMEKGGKVKEPMVVRGFFEDEAYEYAKGGYVAVSEKDGYWYIMSTPTSKEKAHEIINMGVTRGEVGKVVTLKEAKEHKKVIGEEYLEHGGKLADGGMTSTKGLKKGDFVQHEGNYKYYKVIDILGKDPATFFHTGRNNLKLQDLETGEIFTANEARYDKSTMADGGEVSEKEVVESNAQMVLSQIKAVKHHADELAHIVSTKSDIEAWVVAKIERASTDLSDITHYLDGQHQKMSMGGSVYNYTHKMDKK